MTSFLNEITHIFVVTGSLTNNNCMSSGQQTHELSSMARPKADNKTEILVMDNSESNSNNETLQDVQNFTHPSAGIVTPTEQPPEVYVICNNSLNVRSLDRSCS